jgi:hypothetical protein
MAIVEMTVASYCKLKFMLQVFTHTQHIAQADVILLCIKHAGL